MPFAHYTDAAGLVGIVRDSGLRMSDARYLNDSAELSHGIEVTKRLLNERLSQSSAEDRPQIESMITEVDAAYDDGLPLIACFSTEIDSLGQWRGYGGNSVSLCLEFDEVRLRAAMPESVTFDRCRYQEAEQCSHLQQIIDEHLARRHGKPVPQLDEIGKWLPNGYWEAKYPGWNAAMEEVKQSHRKLMSPEACAILSGQGRPRYTNFAHRLVSALPFIKHSSFSSESEYRVLLPKHESDDDLEFRVRGNMIVPFSVLKLFVKGDPGPLTTIRLGPGSDHASLKRSIETLVYGQQWWGVRIEKSNSTYRW